MGKIRRFLINEITTFKNPQNILLSFQHALSAFGGTILIPILISMSPSLGLFCAGIATLLYAASTKGKIPLLLGSSACFIAPILSISKSMGQGYAIGGLIGSAITYLLLAIISYIVGYKRIKTIFPNIVTGSIIIVIAITLVPVALSMASGNYLLALISALLMILFCSSNNKYLNKFPVLLTIIISYITAYCMGLVDFSLVGKTQWFSLPQFIHPQYNLSAIFVMMLIAIVSFMEHLGELTANSIITGDDHFKNVGLHKSLIGDALGLLFAGIVGGCPDITYGENSSIIAITGNKNPTLIRGAAVIVIILSLFGKVGALLQVMPLPIVGGLSFVIFGMIFSSGLTTIKNANVDILSFKNASVIFLPVFIGVASLLSNNPLSFVITPNFTLEGLSLSALVGITLNCIYLISDKFKGVSNAQ